MAKDIFWEFHGHSKKDPGGFKKEGRLRSVSKVILKKCQGSFKRHFKEVLGISKEAQRSFTCVSRKMKWCLREIKGCLKRVSTVKL